MRLLARPPRSVLGLFPSLFLLFLAVASSIGSPLVRGDKPVREVLMEARKFEFEPSRIEIELGDKLLIKITSRDVIHGFNIIGTKINVPVPPGVEVVVAFEPDKPGEYRFKCSKVCGEGHLLMRGVIVVRK